LVEHFHGKEGVTGSSPVPGSLDGTLVIREGEGEGTEFPLHAELVLGREQGSADVVLTDPGISRRHAAVRAGAGRVTVEDLGSSNGTFVNGSRIRGEFELADGDEIQIGGTVLSVHGADAATALMAPGVDPTAAHPGPIPAPAPPRPAAPRGQRGPAPNRLAPRPDDESNIPAFAAAFLGPLSLLLILFSTGAAFFVALPCAVGAIICARLGARRADASGGRGHRTLASVGRITGIIGVILSVLAILAFIVVAAALDATEDSLDGIVDRIREEIEGVDIPDAPDVNTPDGGGSEDGSGGTPPN
jgi:pSer/pThr/pTyr-binding forkhead associated (FHA) protein